MESSQDFQQPAVPQDNGTPISQQPAVPQDNGTPISSPEAQYGDKGSKDNKNKTFSIVAMCCGIAGVVLLFCSNSICSWLGLAASIVGLVFGIIVLKSKQEQVSHSKGFAITGIAVGGAGILLFVAALIIELTVLAKVNSVIDQGTDMVENVLNDENVKEDMKNLYDSAKQDIEESANENEAEETTTSEESTSSSTTKTEATTTYTTTDGNMTKEEAAEIERQTQEAQEKIMQMMSE